MGFSSFLVTQIFHIKYLSKLFSVDTIHIQISANYKIIPACSCPRLHNCYGEWEDWDPVNWFSHTTWVAIITPTDLPKSAHNRCLVEDFSGVFVLSRCFLIFPSV